MPTPMMIMKIQPAHSSQSLLRSTTLPSMVVVASSNMAVAVAVKPATNRTAEPRLRRQVAGPSWVPATYVR